VGEPAQRGERYPDITKSPNDHVQAFDATKGGNRARGSDEGWVANGQGWSMMSGRVGWIRKASSQDPTPGDRSLKLKLAKSCFRDRWIHDFETRQQILRAVESSYSWSTRWSRISGGRGRDTTVLVRGRQAGIECGCCSQVPEVFLQG